MRCNGTGSTPIDARDPVFLNRTWSVRMVVAGASAAVEPVGGASGASQLLEPAKDLDERHGCCHGLAPARLHPAGIDRYPVAQSVIARSRASCVVDYSNWSVWLGSGGNQRRSLVHDGARASGRQRAMQIPGFHSRGQRPSSTAVVSAHGSCGLPASIRGQIR
jgi:hypothetical protein